MSERIVEPESYRFTFGLGQPGLARSPRGFLGLLWDLLGLLLVLG
jgi:hypothetical protein